MELISPSSVTAAHDLRAVFSRLWRQIRELATGDDLTPSQTAALVRLAKDGPSSTSQLAGAERVRPQSMATTVAALERHGLIARSPDPADGRRQVISLTAEGRGHAERGRQARDEWLTCAMQERFTEAERRSIITALGLLDRLTES